MIIRDRGLDFSRTIQDLALLYTENHLRAKAENDEQVNPYYDPQGAMDYMLDTYFEAIGYITGKTREYAKTLGDQLSSQSETD